MSKNTQLGNLVNGIFVDSSRRVGIGTQSPSVALDVLGAGVFSGAVTASSLSSPEKVSTIFGINAATSSGNGGSLTIKAGNGSGAGNTSGSLYLGFGRGGASASSGAMYFGVAQATDAVGLDATYMTLTSAGNVGIGTTSPNKLLELAANSPVLRLTTTTQNTPSSIELGVLNGGNYGYAKIGVTNVQDYDTNLTFWTTPATSTTQVERMRITKDGNVGIGTNDPVSYSTRTLQIHNSVNNHAYIKLTNIDTGAALSDGFELASAGVNANIVLRESTGIITIRGLSGGVYLSNGSTSWAANSDERLKNINSNIENAVEKLSFLRAVNFSWKSDLSNREVLGLIAQDVEKAFPQIIDKNKIASDPSEENIDTTEYLGVRYVELIPVLVKAIQELKAEIDILKQK